MPAREVCGVRPAGLAGVSCLAVADALDEHWGGGVADHVIGRGAHHRASEPAPTACADDDDARRQLLGEVADGGTGFSDHGHQLDVGESESVDRGDQVVAGECVTARLDLGVEVCPGRGGSGTPNVA